MNIIRFILTGTLLAWGYGLVQAADSETVQVAGCVRSIVWDKGEDGSEGYRIPGIVVTPGGTVLAFAESRITYSDDAPKHLVMKRSLDGGTSWSETFYIEKSDGSYWSEHQDEIAPSDYPDKKEVWTNVAPVVDKVTGRVFFFYSLSEGAVGKKNLQRYTKVFYRYSDDEGQTWSGRMEVTSLLHVKKDGSPHKDKNGQWIPDANGFPCDYLGRAFHMPGPGHGIQLSSGRLLLPVWHRKALGGIGGTTTALHARQYGLSTLYSDDHGATWKHDSFFGHDGLNMNESRLVELNNGDIYINARYVNNNPDEKNNHRMVAVSHDGGICWSDIRIDKSFPLSNPCDGGLIRVKNTENDTGYLLYTKNESPDGRKNLVARLSPDEGKTWYPARTLVEGRVSYSDLAVLSNTTILVLYETGKYQPLYCLKMTSGYLAGQRDCLAAEVKTTSGMIPEIPFPKGLGGAYTGISSNVLIVAGGSFFDKPLWENGKKVYTDSIYVCTRKGNGYSWQTAGRLPYKVAHGASVTTTEGVLCLGGMNDGQIYADVFLLTWDTVKHRVIIRSFPSLPRACYYPAATQMGDDIYVIGGLNGKPLNTCWKLSPGKNCKWETMPSPSLSGRFGSVLLSQQNGQNECLYLFGGKSAKNYLVDAYCFDPVQNGGQWNQLVDIPRPVLGAPAVAAKDSLLFIFSGSDGHDTNRINEIREAYRFTPQVLSYNTHTGSWQPAGCLPMGVVNAPVVKWNSRLLIPGGETRPGVRTPGITLIELNNN